MSWDVLVRVHRSVPWPGPHGNASLDPGGLIFLDAFPWGAWPRDAAVDTRK